MLWPAGTRPSQQEQGHQQVDLNAHWQVQPHTLTHRGADMQGPCHPLHSMMRSPPAGSLTCIPPWQTLPRAFGQTMIRAIHSHLSCCNDWLTSVLFSMTFTSHKGCNKHWHESIPAQRPNRLPLCYSDSGILVSTGNQRLFAAHQISRWCQAD